MSAFYDLARASGHVLLLLAASTLLLVPARAQVTVTTSVFGSGGGAAAGTTHRVLGTLGQPLAARTPRVASGFWPGASAFTLATARDDDPAAERPRAYRLDANYPNPFNPQTTIQYTLPQPARVRLIVYNVLGQAVRALVDAEQAAGTHTVRWDGRSDTGALLGSGAYLYRIEAGRFRAARTMLLVK